MLGEVDPAEIQADHAEDGIWSVMKQILQLFMTPNSGLDAKSTRRIRWDYLWRLYSKNFGLALVERQSDLKKIIQSETGAPDSGLLPAEFANMVRTHYFDGGSEATEYVWNAFGLYTEKELKAMDEDRPANEDDLYIA